jgi:hypothetical protein
MLALEVDGWMTGVNKNVAGKQKRYVLILTSDHGCRVYINDLLDQ